MISAEMKPLVLWGGIAVASFIIGAIALSMLAGEFPQHQRQAQVLYTDYKEWYLNAPGSAIDAQRATAQRPNKLTRQVMNLGLR